MKRGPALGLAHSLQVRLKAKAEAEGRPFAEVLDLYGIERLLHRLGRSEHRDLFILKGALLIRHWLGSDTRPTRDVDLMGPPRLDAQLLQQVLGDVLKTGVEDDGLEFDLASLRIDQIRDTSPIPGYRAKFEGFLGQMVIRYQVDIVPAAAFYPGETRAQMAGILGMPVADIRAYTPYSVVAEKLEAMVALGDVNSRMKDYYDLAALAMNLRFEGETLVEAIRVCFRERSTALPEGTPLGLSDDFSGGNPGSGFWAAFVRKARLPEAFSEFSDVVEVIRGFALPPLRAARTNVGFPQDWPPGGRWQDRGSE
jgi:hypothetical protein